MSSLLGNFSLQQESKIIVVIPAHNEGRTVAEVVKGVKDVLSCEIVVVDDFSTDNTISSAQSAGATVLPLSFQVGAWGAMQTGIRYALKKGGDIVITMDADGQHNPNHIPILLAAFNQQKNDVVIGACPMRASWQRRLAWNFFRTITNIKLNDLTSGFRVYGRRTIELLASPNATLFDYQDIGVLLLLQKNNLSTVEVTVQMNERASGHSRIFFSWFAVCRYLALSTLISFSCRNFLIQKK